MQKHFYSWGFSLPELLLIVTVIGVLLSSVFLLIKPDELRKRSRDSRRLTDLFTLSSAIEQFTVDHGNIPPDLSGPTRVSLEAIPGHFPAESNGSGWINADLTKYIEKLPLDPLNTDSFLYRYKRVGTQYEIDSAMEILNDLTNNRYDGGNNNSRYEVGTNLEILN